MLPPDPHALWLVSFLLVVVTRDFAAMFVPFAVIAQAMVWMTSDANSLVGAATFDFVVRRASYAVYGAVAGYAVAAALGTRVLVPVHSFVGKRVHWAGPVSLLSVSYGVYALATGTGLTQAHLPFGDQAWDSDGSLALFWIIFVLMLFVAGSVAWTSWHGIAGCPMAYRYRDGGIKPRQQQSPHPASRFAAEAALALALLIAPHFIWIYTSLPPVGWPQYVGGSIALGVVALFWIALWRGAQDRYGMEMSYFHVDESRVSWTAFAAVVGGVHFCSMIAYIIVGAFTSTALASEITLIVTTAVTIVVAVLAWLFLTSAFTTSPPRRSNIVAQPKEPLTDSGGAYLNGSSNAGSDSAAAMDRRSKRLEALL